MGFRSALMVGPVLFFDGFFGLFYGIPAWLANPLWFLAIALAYFRRVKIRAILGATAFLLSLTSLFAVGTSVPRDEGGTVQIVLLRLLDAPRC